MQRRMGLAVLIALVTTSAAQAALFIDVSSTDELDAIAVGQEFTLDITIWTSGPEAIALGFRVTDWDDEVLDYVSATAPLSIFNFAPSAPPGTLFNVAHPPSLDTEGGPGNSVVLFLGVASFPQFGTGPEYFSVTFRGSALGTTVLNTGAFPEYLDTYIGGDNVVYNQSTRVTVVPEPSAAVLLGLGLIGVASRARRP